jgi:hypothetical protein
MRARAAGGAIGLVLIVLAGCGGTDPAPAGLPSDPPPSLPSLSPVSPSASPVSTVESTATGQPPVGLVGTLETYETLSADWQRTRSVFFAAVTDGKPRDLPAQRALAAAYLRGLRAFAAGMQARAWPPAANGHIAELLAANAAQQAHVAAMATAGSAAAFTAALAAYGIGAGPENSAVAAVQRALGG